MFTLPLVPAGTTAEFAMIMPGTSFKVDATGCGCPVGQIVRKYKGAPPGGATVTFSE